jgi:hypothetical protein
MGTFEKFFNGFPGRLILMLLTSVTSIFSAIGTIYIKSLNGDLNSIKSEVSDLIYSAKLSEINKVNVNDHNKQQILINERFHTIDVRTIKLEETAKATADALIRIERKLSEKTE